MGTSRVPPKPLPMPLRPALSCLLLAAASLAAAPSHAQPATTGAGAAALVQGSSDAPEVLRQRVTSKGGTTYAALTAMDQAGIKDAFVQAMHAACTRAKELGDEFGR